MRSALALVLLVACAPTLDDTGSDDVGTNDVDTFADVDTDTDTDADSAPLDADAWRLSAGAATVQGGERPFDTLRDDLPLESLAQVAQGRELFVADWIVQSSTPSVIDGLGPYFHAASCRACHPASGRPSSLAADGTVLPGLLVRLGHVDTEQPDPVYGAALAPSGVLGVEPEAEVRWYSEDAEPLLLSDGSVALTTVTLDIREATLAQTTATSPRLSPQLVGASALGAVPLADLLALEDPDDADGDGISGRVARLGPDTDWRAGRFGWKATEATVLSQTAAALSADMGITSTLHPEQSCTPAQTDCLDAVTSDDPEISDNSLEHLVAYMDALGVPERRVVPGVQQGQGVFERIGCAACHVDTLRTADDAEPAHLAQLTLHPYTDLLLHDMGPGLADPIGAGDAEASEWRTPPLWGIGLVAQHSNARFLHDARAASLTEAIAWHGGEALASRDGFASLSVAEREALLAFLSAL